MIYNLFIFLKYEHEYYIFKGFKQMSLPRSNLKGIRDMRLQTYLILECQKVTSLLTSRGKYRYLQK